MPAEPGRLVLVPHPQVALEGEAGPQPVLVSVGGIVPPAPSPPPAAPVEGAVEAAEEERRARAEVAAEFGLDGASAGHRKGHGPVVCTSCSSNAPRRSRLRSSRWRPRPCRQYAESSAISWEGPGSMLMWPNAPHNARRAFARAAKPKTDRAARSRKSTRAPSRAAQLYLLLPSPQISQNPPLSSVLLAMDRHPYPCYQSALFLDALTWRRHASTRVPPRTVSTTSIQTRWRRLSGGQRMKWLALPS